MTSAEKDLKKLHAALTPDVLVKADAEAGIVHLMTGQTGSGENFWAYIAVKPSRYEDFILSSRAQEEMNLHEFGDILESGFGTEPPADVRRTIESRDDIEVNFIQKVIDMAAAAGIRQ